MVTEYKPTQDPNLDTFKVEYLLGFAAVLGILFPKEYTIMEVRARGFALHEGHNDLLVGC